MRPKIAKPGQRCTADNPCPGRPTEDPMKWTHTFETTYYGQWFNVVECPHCGLTLKAEPRPAPPEGA